MRLARLWGGGYSVQKLVEAGRDRSMVFIRARAETSKRTPALSSEWKQDILVSEMQATGRGTGPSLLVLSSSSSGELFIDSAKPCHVYSSSLYKVRLLLRNRLSEAEIVGPLQP